MNGAQALIRTLIACGVDTCFMNPGTSEMHFVAALDTVPEMHSVLALFEGVATGAADGYARMADRPAATLLHLGPGLGNGLANLHNARRAQSPVVNIVGDHATYHKQYDAQLESDIETVARNVSSFIRRSAKTEEVGSDAADTVAAAFGPPGQVATLLLPADISWGDGGEPSTPTNAGAPSDGRRRDGRRDRGRTPVGGTSRAARGRQRLPRIRVGPRPLDRRRDGRQAAVRDLPGADRTGRGPRARRPHRVPRRVRGDATRGRAPPRDDRCQSAGLVLRVSREGELARPRRLRGAHARRARR